MSVVRLTPKRYSSLLTGHSSPETLGSPAGYVVLPGHRLLWPHPRLSVPPPGLSSSSTRWYPNREVPQFTLLVCLHRAAFRTPVVGEGALDCFFPLTHWPSPNQYRLGSHNVPSSSDRKGSVTRLQSSLHATARQTCLRSSDLRVYIRASVSRVASRKRRI